MEAVPAGRADRAQGTRRCLGVCRAGVRGTVAHTGQVGGAESSCHWWHLDLLKLPGDWTQGRRDAEGQGAGQQRGGGPRR